MYSSGCYRLQKNYPYEQGSFMSIRYYQSLQNLQQTISDQNRVFLRQSVRLKIRRLNLLQYIHHRLYFPMASSMFRFPEPLHLTTSLLHRQRTETDKLMTSQVVFREVLQSFRYIYKYLLMKHFILSTCQLFAQVHLVSLILRVIQPIK